MVIKTKTTMTYVFRNHPGEIFDYDSSSEEESMFQSFQEAFNYMKEQMETDEDEDEDED
jgi:hypothetical protein